MGKNKKDVNMDIEEILEDIEFCDQYIDVYPKEKNVTCNSESTFMISCARAQDYLVSLICALNGIDQDDYLISDSDYGLVMAGPIGIQHEFFQERSFLKWDENDYYDTDFVMFKLRFLTTILCVVMTRVDDIILRRLRHVKKITNPFATAYADLQDLVNDCKKLVVAVLTDEADMFMYLDMYFHMSYYRKQNQRNQNHMIYEGFESLYDDLYGNLNDNKYLDPDMKIYLIIRLAYLMCTQQESLKKLPKFKEIEGATPKHNLSLLLKELGKQILSIARKKKIGVMYKCWLDASPEILTNLQESTDDVELIQGICAVMFVGHISSDDRIQFFVEDMIDEGI